MMDPSNDPHQGRPVLTVGAPLPEARAAMILLHGRGATAQDILPLSQELQLPGFAYLAPQATGGAWYPERFLAPTRTNQPWLDSALRVVDSMLDRLTENGIPQDRVILLGFSQGACLALESAARRGGRFGGVAGLSGGLIGAPGEPRQDAASLDGTPVFLGCSETDFHIPRESVQESARVLGDLGAEVTVRLYPHLGHTINEDELAFIRQMMSRL